MAVTLDNPHSIYLSSESEDEESYQIPWEKIEVFINLVSNHELSKLTSLDRSKLHF